MDAPAPGKMPIMLPMIQERMIVGERRLISGKLNANLFLNLVAAGLALIFLSAAREPATWKKDLSGRR